MPYITQTARKIIDEGGTIQTAGELNYTFTKELKKFFCTSTRQDLREAVEQLIGTYIALHGTNYATFNDIIGALECAQFEFKRRTYTTYKREWVDDAIQIFKNVKNDFYTRVVSPYEDEKIKLNGDVY
jgi:hypothetical protein